jgi:type III secretory pathway component EscR
MSKDPIVQQVRAVRKKIERQYPDAESFYKHLEQQQKAYRDRLTRRKPKQARRARAS